MKKIFIAALIAICLILGGFLFYKNTHDNNASREKIYTLNDNKVLYDLNCDGEDETIVLDTYEPDRGYTLKIYQRQKFKNVDIGALVGFEKGIKIEILDTKTLGYYDMKIYLKDTPPLVIKLDGASRRYGFDKFAGQKSFLNQKREKLFSLSKNYNKKAQEIMFKELKKTKILIREEVHAFFYDLDDDMTDEIIGIVVSPEFRTRWGYGLYIFKQDNGGYKDICSVLGVDTGNKIEILDTKTNGFYDLKIHFVKDTPLIVKYKNKEYSFVTGHVLRQE